MESYLRLEMATLLATFNLSLTYLSLIATGVPTTYLHLKEGVFRSPTFATTLTSPR